MLVRVISIKVSTEVVFLIRGRFKPTMVRTPFSGQGERVAKLVSRVYYR